jgi:hypothetical protein
MKLYTYRKTSTAVAALAILGGGIVAPLLAPCTANAAVAVPPALGAEIRNSRLPGFQYFELPGYAHKLSDTRLEEELAAQLKAADPEAKKAGYKVEVVAWSGNNASDDTREMLRATCLGSGRHVEEDGDRFTARSDADKSVVTGIWTRRDGVLLLTWGTAGPAEAPRRSNSMFDILNAAAKSPENQSSTSSSSSSSASSAAPKGTGRKIAAPSNMVGGSWSWTTISGTNYVRQDGTLASPSGMSAKFSFKADSSYTYFFYVQQRTYNLVTQATTTENGKATFYDNGTVLLKPSKGHYKGFTGSRALDRDMKASELGVRTYYWEWRTVDGKQQLFIGPTRSSMSHFKR